MTDLKYFLYEKYIKCFCNVPEEKRLASSRILYSFIKSFVSPIVDIASTFTDGLFNLFSTNTYFVLFELITLLKPNNLLSKSVFFTKLAISLSVAKFACFNLAAKFPAVNLLNSGVII